VRHEDLVEVLNQPLARELLGSAIPARLAYNGLDGLPEYLAASRKGIPEDRWESFEAEVRSLYKQMARIAITPQWTKLIDFETTLPSAVERAIRERAASS
jgi:hypothetical protein